jgi:hypothetical protein
MKKSFGPSFSGMFWFPRIPLNFFANQLFLGTLSYSSSSSSSSSQVKIVDAKQSSTTEADTRVEEGDNWTQ